MTQRKAGHSGTFYPRFSQQIEQMISIWNKIPIDATTGKRSLALLSPHAGYTYSGLIAARGYRVLASEPIDSLLILHPCHQASHFDFALSPYDSYDAVVGTIEQDKELDELLSELNADVVHPSYHQKEHSLEIQLPLIKHFFPHSKICPVMLGRQNPENAQRLASTIYSVLTRSNKRIAVIASTDLSHYHHASKAQILDSNLQEKLLYLDAEGLWTDIISGKSEACGIGAVLTLIYLARQFSSASFEMLSYSHSGMVAGNNQQVVGYLSARLVV